ncbi:outer membrane protein assembly factor BamA [Methylovorus sp. MM2]|uniref:outer membrane protein assembly factor BamA n=1 Tax=Methylovorus sp. MM2 TaxID=1848038 RepID=UPI0007DF04B4|nr:outer membrane protein assembly factor BamA [Methylovorus sp. MM2]OAM52984.1 outer membrane protein assembly factor BamA [Methylovorus sp. MM2]
MKLGITLRHILLFVVACYTTSAMALEPFIVKDIRVEGIQRTDAGTVFNYLPVKVGDTMTDEKATQAIKSLYGTGFFKDVRIEVDQDVLVITLQERAAIADITFSGNKSFPSDKMKDGLKQIGLSEGLIFDRSMLDKAEQEIKRQYLSQGKYGASVKTVVSPMERNRVGIRFDIEEGAVSKIRSINIVGNQSFETKALLEQFKLTTPDWLSWWNKNDQYSKQKLTADLETLRSFYMNQGYLEFNIESTQVSITPDKRDIYITVNISEGEKYTVTDVKLAGEMLLPEDEARKLISVESGEVFNRQKVTDSSKAINDRLGNDGYAFANVNAVPDVNKDAHTVAFTFFVDPGRRVYVRRINLTGNTRTRDDVLRREMRQLESAWYGADKIERSKQRLDRLQFFSDVNVETPAVPGTTDQVDLNINVTEKSTGSVMFGAGLSSAEGVVFGVTVNQNNFLGTGNRVSAQVNTGKVNTVYSLSYTDPYFTPDGISRGFDVYRRDVDTSRLSGNIGSYSTSSYGTGVRFGVPLNERDSVGAGLTFDYTSVDLTSSSPIQYRRYCNGNNSNSTDGCENNSLLLNLSWAHDTRDNVLFPNKGVYQRISSEIGLPGLDLQYYKIEYKHSWYKDVTPSVTLMLNGEAGYGDSYGDNPFPFFKNFYIGGVNNVRGYQTSAIGPRFYDSVNDRGYAVGGTKRLMGNAELFFPVPGMKDSKQLRLSTFFDAGSVAGDYKYQVGGVDRTLSTSVTDLRYSVGLGVSWFSPFGPIKLVLAKALNAKNETEDPNKPYNDDKTQILQFQMGSQF